MKCLSSDDPTELARSLDGAEVPVDDLPRAEPDAAGSARGSIPGNSDGRPGPDTYQDVSDATVDIRNIRAQFNKTAGEWSGNTVDSVWSGAGSRGEAVRKANARWSEFATARRTSSTAFGDDPRQLLYGADDLPNTIDSAHAAHYVPRPRRWESARETGFGRLAQGWNEFPFSHRELVVNALSRGEALSPNQVVALESALEGYRAGGGALSSSQYRAMTDMISDLGDAYRHARWHTAGGPDERLVQLIEMLDYAAAAV